MNHFYKKLFLDIDCYFPFLSLLLVFIINKNQQQIQSISICKQGIFNVLGLQSNSALLSFLKKNNLNVCNIFLLQVFLLTIDQKDQLNLFAFYLQRFHLTLQKNYFEFNFCIIQDLSLMFLKFILLILFHLIFLLNKHHTCEQLYHLSVNLIFTTM